MVDAADLKSASLRECRFESGSGHQTVVRLYFKRRLVRFTAAPIPANGLEHRRTHKPQGLPGTGPNGQLGALVTIENRGVRHAVHLDAAQHVLGKEPVKPISGSLSFAYPAALLTRIGAIQNPRQISPDTLARLWQ